ATDRTRTSSATLEVISGNHLLGGDGRQGAIGRKADILANERDSSVGEGKLPASPRVLAAEGAVRALAQHPADGRSLAGRSIHGILGGPVGLDMSLEERPDVRAP